MPPKVSKKLVQNAQNNTNNKKRKPAALPVNTVDPEKQAQWLLSTNLLIEAYKKQNEDTRQLLSALNQKKKGIISSLKSLNFHGEFEDVGAVETVTKTIAVTELPTQLLLQAIHSGKQINDDLLLDLTRQHEESIKTDVKVRFFRPKVLPHIDPHDVTTKLKKQIKNCPYFPPLPQRAKKIKLLPSVRPVVENDNSDEDDEDEDEDDEEEQKEAPPLPIPAIVLVKSENGEYKVKDKPVEKEEEDEEDDAETDEDEDEEVDQAKVPAVQDEPVVAAAAEVVVSNEVPAVVVVPMEEDAQAEKEATQVKKPRGRPPSSK